MSELKTQLKSHLFSAYLTGQTDATNRENGAHGRPFNDWYKENNVEQKIIDLFPSPSLQELLEQVDKLRPITLRAELTTEEDAHYVNIAEVKQLIRSYLGVSAEQVKCAYIDSTWTDFARGDFFQVMADKINGSKK